MPVSKFPKDVWIVDALKAGHIVANIDGTILRRSSTGELQPQRYQVHKKSGRVFFNMTWRGHTKSVLVNRVIALRFLPNPQNLPQVNHVDGDKENNALYQADGSYQLEWSSGSDNEKHAHRNGLKTGRGTSNANAKLTPEQVLAIRESQASIPELIAQFGVARSTIINIRTNRTWKHV